MADELPDETETEAERLTRLARNAVDESEAAAYREERERLLTGRDYVAREREDDGRTVLVLHPAEWIDDGTVRIDRVEDTSRAVEVPLDGPGDPEDWDEVDAHNRELAARVRAEHGDVHGDNAVAFADFMGNHRAKRIESATPEEREEFLAEYFTRNAWPSDEQRAVVERSVELLFEVADEQPF